MYILALDLIIALILGGVVFKKVARQNNQLKSKTNTFQIIQKRAKVKFDSNLDCFYL